MKYPLIHWLPITLGLVVLSSGVAAARDLSFEDRTKCQEAIERVYYSHQIGANKAFGEAVHREVLEKKVRTYLAQSVALEKFWNMPVTAAALQSELARIARKNRFPDRLREIYDALANDPLLIQECFARPILVDRLSRSFFAGDERIHGPARVKAEELRNRAVSGAIDVHSASSSRTEVEVGRVDTADAQVDSEIRPIGDASPGDRVPRLEKGAEDYQRLKTRMFADGGRIGPIREDSMEFMFSVLLDEGPDYMRTATFSSPKVSWDSWWQEVESEFRVTDVKSVASPEAPLPETNADSMETEDSAGCPTPNTWDNGVLDDLPLETSGHRAVWTGTLMLVWGGFGFGSHQTMGQRYDPLTDTWALMSTQGQPSGRSAHSAVWTGSRMIVWGGAGTGIYFNTGGQYDPVADSWTPTSSEGAPSPRSTHTAVWTGTEMIVWGGGSLQNTGGRYDPATDTWSAVTLTGAPSGRSMHTAIWTGSAMIVWGGYGGSGVFLNTGGSYNPAADSWVPTSTVGTPSGRYDHSAVWTGTEMIVWGGASPGGRYNPNTDSWSTVSTVNAPPERSRHAAVWTGQWMVIWGGRGDTNTGGRYDPQTDQWMPTALVNAPSARTELTGVWTGDRMVVWGGKGSMYQPLKSGGRYDPATDTWTPTADPSGPTTRGDNSFVWTGNEMIIWGGGHPLAFGDYNTGARYNPLTDSWTDISTMNTPSGRRTPAVWTGNEMVIWGGVYYNGFVTNTGGRYNPLTDTWTSTSLMNAPTMRTGHTAVWTGNRVIVWGGQIAPSYLNSGGRYDPATDTWTSLSTVNAPSARAFATAVWTGSRMIVWGGSTSVRLNTGGIYDPVSNSWTPTTLDGVPSPRDFHSAIWTGSRMVIWGGKDSGALRSGAQYDPQTDTWFPTSTTGAAGVRYDHGVVWTGNLMVVWGGTTGFEILNTGGRYDPAADTWKSTSTVGAPAPRQDPTIVWTGDFMIIWGGTVPGGGRYIAEGDPDGDGFAVCAGDCNDGDPAVHPGATEICNGIDDNCATGIDEGGGAALCPDANSCTNDVCGGASGCSHPVLPDGTACDDANLCTIGESCLTAACQGGSLKDLDADGYVDAGCGGDDCNDTNPMVWSPPIEIPNLGLTSASPAELYWEAEDFAGPETAYDLVSGMAGGGGSDFTTASCLVSSSTSTNYSDLRPDPAPGSGFWYLARARNSCGIGTYGFTTLGAERLPSACP
jgi:N-acetylneuraminic acid mutarotase